MTGKWIRKFSNLYKHACSVWVAVNRKVLVFLLFCLLPFIFNRKIRHICFTVVFANWLLPGGSNSFSKRKDVLLFLFFPIRNVLTILHHNYLDPDLNVVVSHVDDSGEIVNIYVFWITEQIKFCSSVFSDLFPAKVLLLVYSIYFVLLC